MNVLDQAIGLLRDGQAEYVAQLREMIGIRSVSTEPACAGEVARMAAWLAEALRERGMVGVEVMQTGGHPVVFGEYHAGADRPTVLVYGHYDVQPVDPVEEWVSEPFGGEVRGEYVYGRGVSDMKGQFFAFLKALEALVKTGGLNVNLKYLLEGEEEIGSPNLARFVEAYREKLACDVVLNCDASMLGADLPAIVYSLRGLAYFELMVQGPGKDLHSGVFGGTVLNPIHVLCEVLAGLHDEEGRVILPSFYDRVRPLAREERELLAQLPYSDAEWAAMAGMDKDGLCGEAGYSTLERVGARPCLDVNGIWGGFTGEGAKTVLPARAYAKLSTRLVADQQPQEVEGQLRAYLETHMPKGVQWTLSGHSWGPGATMERDSQYMKAAQAALTKAFGREPLFKREGGSVPVVGLLQEVLDADSIMLGFSLPDDGIHGPNEHQHLPTLFRGMEAYVHFLYALSEMKVSS